MSTREKILSEALNLFYEAGYESTSMRKLADSAGMKASSLYNHFISKESILLELAQLFGPGSAIAALTEITKESSEPSAVLPLFYKYMLSQWMQPETLKLISVFTKLPTAHNARKYVDDGIEELRVRITDHFNRWIEAGYLDANYPSDYYFLSYVSPLLYARGRMLEISCKEDFECLETMCRTHIDCFLKQNFR